MLSEFEIIRECFEQPDLAAKESELVKLGIGDDCTLLDIPPEYHLAVSMDTLVESVHFPVKADPHLVAYRALAVSLSDLAAMGAKPLGFTLGLTLPLAKESWLTSFSKGLKECAMKYHCPLLGGDTTKGPLTITIQVHGLVRKDQAMTRSGARPGDKIFVTGSLGVAALAIRVLQEKQTNSADDRALMETAFYRPLPRIEIGMKAAGIVTAGIDISDGLLADLGHICERSNTGADITLASIPLYAPLARDLSAQEALTLALTGGDDYELLLTASSDNEQALLAIGQEHDVPILCIGEITKDRNIRCLDSDGNDINFIESGYQHF